MRTRDEIDRDYDAGQFHDIRPLLEVLLDMRELLEEIKRKLTP